MKQIGAEPWAVNSHKNCSNAKSFHNELSAVNYAYRMSRKRKTAAVYRNRELVVRWHDGEVYEAPGRKDLQPGRTVIRTFVD
jgi:hypothetical protein